MSHRPVVSSSIGSSRRPSPFSTLHRSSSSLLLELIWLLEGQIEQIVDPIILLLHFPSTISSASFGSSLRFFKLIFCKDTPEIIRRIVDILGSGVDLTEEAAGYWTLRRRNDHPKLVPYVISSAVLVPAKTRIGGPHSRDRGQRRGDFRGCGAGRGRCHPNDEKEEEI
ncbi:uncharacterized protein G2W53_032564 [Senna tora]|uniref:Uncharacterized protein n=1 Tax=Senna tora TaxID=362788 RepID=A0A834SXS3_9FABA|nr:uncharacterized protein G2W53_032564 [Senna tora]